MAEVVAQDGKGPNEGPAVGMQLGRGHVNFSKEHALEPREWQVKFDLLEDFGVHEEEGFFRVCAIIDAYRFAFPTRLDRDIHIVFPPEYTKLIIRLVFLIGLYVFVGGYLGSFSHEVIISPMIDGSVINGGKRVRCGFGTSHRE